MNEFKIPEMFKMNLDHVVLRLKQFKISDIASFDFI